MSEEKEYFWRYHDPMYSGGEIYLQPVEVVRRTPQGVWVKEFEGQSADEPLKFINFKWNKQFAHATKEAALASYKARKRRQIEILSAQLKYAEHCLYLAEHGKPMDEPFTLLFASEP